MKFGKKMNEITDSVAPGVGLIGLALAPFTGGSSLLLSIQALGASKMVSYGIQCIEDEFKKK